MSRSHRLFDLLQNLRRHRGVVSGAVLAAEADVSLRTIRRDIALLQAMGADIDAQAGVGYVLRPGFLLPPLSFTEEELHALVVGAQWVARQPDAALAQAIRNALAKIDGVLSPAMRPALDDSSFYVGSGMGRSAEGLDMEQCRRALREQRKMKIAYREGDAVSERVVWPIMLGLTEADRSVAAWCETSGAYAVFRSDRIVRADVLEERYHRNRRQMVKEWRASPEHPCTRTNA